MQFQKENNNTIHFTSDFKQLLGSFSRGTYLKDFELEVQCHKKNLVPIATILKYNSLYLYNSLIDLTVADHSKKNTRFVLFYQLSSDTYPNRARILTQTNEKIHSLIKVYPNACWAEREAWDMFGVFFTGNYDLRRILTDYGFDDFPLQKTFKLTGTYELSYSDPVKRVVYQHITETQKFREFHFSNPWGSFSQKDQEEDFLKWKKD